MGAHVCGVEIVFRISGMISIMVGGGEGVIRSGVLLNRTTKETAKEVEETEQAGRYEQLRGLAVLLAWSALLISCVRSLV